jgi:hypothetical protein
MTCCDPLAAERPLDLTEDDCRTLIGGPGSNGTENLVKRPVVASDQWLASRRIS